MVVIVGLAACDKKVQEEEAQYTGKTIRMECFDRIGIKTSSATDSLMYVIPDEKMAAAFEQEGVLVTFDLENVRANTLQPIFPDPSIDPGTLFQAKVVNLTVVKQ
jgi:hypothetical protein